MGTHGPTDGEGFLRMEGPADPLVQILFAEDDRGRPLGGVVNFACHPTLTYSVPEFSSDYVGPLVESLAARHGGAFVFLNGTCGNVSPETGNAAFEGTSADQRPRIMGTALARKAEEAIASAVPLAEGPILAARKVLSIPERRPTTEQVAVAREYLARGPKEQDQQAFAREMYGHDYTFYHNSATIHEWLARATVGRWEYLRRVASREARADVEIRVLALGGAAFVAYPAEMFTEFGLETRRRSPFGATLVASLANGWHGYVPTREAFRRGGYETSFGDHSRLVPEAGELMVEAALGLLEGLGSG